MEQTRTSTIYARRFYVMNSKRLLFMNAIISYGGTFAFSEERGYLKTTLCRGFADFCRRPHQRRMQDNITYQIRLITLLHAPTSFCQLWPLAGLLINTAQYAVQLGMIFAVGFFYGSLKLCLFTFIKKSKRSLKYNLCR